MSLVVYTNIGSIKSETALGTTQTSLTNTMQQLASGKQINSASDNAAGMSVVNRMSNQIAGLNQSIKNANDGISVAQTAEGALNQMSAMLNRLRSLSVQAANGTYAQNDRSYIDQEFQNLVQELRGTSRSTTWDQDLHVLGGNTAPFNVQIGLTADQKIAIPLAPMTLKSLGLANSATLVAAGSHITAAVSGTGSKLTISAPAMSSSSDYYITIPANSSTSYTFAIENGSTTFSGAVAAIKQSPQWLQMSAANVKISATAHGISVTYATSHMASAASHHTTFVGSTPTLSLTTISGASNALTAIDQAQLVVNKQNSSLGASVNRLQFTINTLMGTVENTSVSQSQIQDTDYAAASANLSKYQILEQAGVAMLAQANASEQYVLKLLQ